MSDKPAWRKRRDEGLVFEQEVYASWMGEQDAKFRIRQQTGVKKPNGREGRIDLFWDIDDPDDPYFRAVVEIKHTDWDRMKDEAAVRRNVLRHKRQIWSYVESLAIHPAALIDQAGKSPEEVASLKLKAAEEAETNNTRLPLESYTIAPCVTYSKRPNDESRLRYIEALFDEHLIAVVWQDESLEERIARGEDERTRSE